MVSTRTLRSDEGTLVSGRLTERSLPPALRAPRREVTFASSLPGVVDVHFHILPGLDDGPPGLPEAVALAGAAVAAGTSTVVATPHVSSRWPDNDALRIAHAVLLLNRELAAQEIPLQVRRGAEIALTRAVDMPREELGRLGLGGGKWLLTECSSQAPGDGVVVLLRSLLADGHRLLLAHPERIPAFRDDPELLVGLVRDGVRCQVTASALAGRFGPDVERFGGWMLEQGLVHVAASDAHGLSGRSPALARELRMAGVPQPLARWLTQEAPAALLAGDDELPPRPEPLEADGLVRRGPARRRA